MLPALWVTLAGPFKLVVILRFVRIPTSKSFRVLAIPVACLKAVVLSGLKIWISGGRSWTFRLPSLSKQTHDATECDRVLQRMLNSDHCPDITLACGIIALYILMQVQEYCLQLRKYPPSLHNIKFILRESCSDPD